MSKKKENSCTRSYLLRSLNDGDGQRKRHKIPAASNFIVLISSRLIHQMLPFCLFWILILKNCIKVQEKKKKVVVLCSRTRRDVKIGIFTL